MKPVVDKLRKEFEGKVEFRIYNVDTPGSEAVILANKLRVQYVPTFFFVNGDGSVASQFVGEMTEDVLRGKVAGLK